MSEKMPPKVSKKNILKNSFILGILILFCVTPFFLAQWFYYHRSAEITKELGTVNHGQLIQPLIAFNQILDADVAPPSLKPHWYILYVTMSKDQNQTEETEKMLDKIYKIRLALGKNFSQVGELFGTLKSSSLEKNPLKIQEVILSSQGLEKLLAVLRAPQGIFLIDPSRNIFMAYPDNVNSDDIYQDIKRLIANR